jgi:hypothetical protein
MATPDPPILDITDLKAFGAERFGGLFNGPWRQGGNAFGALGVLGTTDPFPMTIIAESVTVFNSDGTTLLIGPAPGVKQIEIGNIVLNTAISLLAGTGGVAATATGTGGISLQPGALGTVNLPPRAAGAGNTTLLRFFDLGGLNAVGFQAADALAASVNFRWPTADAIAANARAALLTNALGDLFFGNSIQSGTANIVNGVSAAIPANITAASLIFCQAANVVPGAGNLTIDYRPLAAGRVIGTPGSFTITAVLAAGTINVLDQSLGIQWLVLNP